MGKIQQLDSRTANMIAAGEVVERPMGVVKELVENAIDAGSTRIRISIEEGGLKKISVQDNGCGMSSEDAQMSFKRHATSKIHKENDLWNIHTLGFRGEALPSIAAVAKTTLVTSDGNEGTKIVIAYGETVSASAYPCSRGTEISVEGLFYQTPARLKHMRSASYEASLIQDVISKFALSHPEIAFRFVNEDRDAFRTSGQNNLLEAVFNVFGQGAAEKAVEVSFHDFDYEVKGYLIKPEITRASNSMMHIFLNGRMVKTYKLYRAVRDGYGDCIPNGRYPLCVLSVTMDSHLLDVNVHPSKWEVRISKEIQLENLLRTEVHDAMHTEEAVTAESTPSVPKPEYYEPIAFDTDDLAPKERKTEVKEEVNEEGAETKRPSLQNYSAIMQEAQEDNELLKKLQVQEKESAYTEEEEADQFPVLQAIGQYREKYILCSAEKGLALIDLNAAGMRISYETILKEMNGAAVMHELLVPITLHADDATVRRADEINAACSDMHITFEPFGHDTLIVHSVPSWLKDLDAESCLNDLLDAFLQEKTFSGREKAASLAASHHRSMYRKMTADEMKDLLHSLSLCENPYYTPQGKAVMVILDDSELERKFAR